RLDAIMVKQSLKWGDIVSGTIDNRLGQLTHARYILRGSVTGSGGQLHVKAQLYETETTRLVTTFQAAGSRTMLNDLSEGLAGDLVAFLTSRKVNRPPNPSREVVSGPTSAVDLFFNSGLGYYRQGQFVRAITEFMKVLA